MKRTSQDLEDSVGSSPDLFHRLGGAWSAQWTAMTGVRRNGAAEMVYANKHSADPMALTARFEQVAFALAGKDLHTKPFIRSFD